MSLATLREESKQTVRRPIGKVIVTWTDPLIDLSLTTTQSENNRVSYPIQVADLIREVPKKWFHTNAAYPVTNADFYPMASDILEARKYQVGWWGSQPADASGEFVTDPTLAVDFTTRLVEGFVVAGDSALDEYPVDFTVTVYLKSGSNYVPVDIHNVVGNTEIPYSHIFTNPHFNTSRIELVVHKWSKPFEVVKIIEFYSAIVETFESDEIMFMNILEEFESSEGTLPVGNISCNEMDLTLQNITDRFFTGNTASNIHNLVKRNRKIEPFLGFQYKNGTKEFIPKGLFWSGDWSVSDNGTGAQTTARDRFELFRKTKFPYETVFPDILEYVSLKFLMETVLDSLYDYMYDFFYDISDLDTTYIIPHFDPEFLKKKTYFDVIQDITAASLAYAYMDLPTDAEVSENGPLNKDILRIKRVDTVFPPTVDQEAAIDITKDDFIEKNQPANTESMANNIDVVYKVFSEDPEEPGKWEEEEQTATKTDVDSITEYGIMEYEYKTSDLIQLQSHAEAVGDSLLRSFKIPRRDIDVLSFGDITLNLADQISIPEYQKNGIDDRGIFALTSLNSEYNGSLRLTFKGRKLRDDTSEIVYKLVQDTDGAITKWQDTDGATDKYQDTGVE